MKCTATFQYKGKVALSTLEQAYAAHDLQMTYLAIAPGYDSLRSEPRFQVLMRKVGLPE